MSSDTDSPIVLAVSDFVAVFNQTLEFAYPSVAIVGELANFRVSKNRWVYFDLKDEFASVKCFGSVYQLSGPLKDGMLLEVKGAPRLHSQFGFSFNVLSLRPVGEGTLKRAAQLLEAKLRAEGLFDESRKRQLPYPPQTIGLIASAQSAAYHDFIKVLNGRWGGTEIDLFDVQVQGEIAPGQIIAAIDYFNQHSEPPEVLVITRGGGSPEDLAAFSTEPVTRAVSGSRIPTMVAVGHEIDICLAELAADQRASTPSNAAEILVPDKKQVALRLAQTNNALEHKLSSLLDYHQQQLKVRQSGLLTAIKSILEVNQDKLSSRRELLAAINPKAVLDRGYAVLRQNGRTIKSGRQLASGQTFEAELTDANIKATVNQVVLE